MGLIDIRVATGLLRHPKFRKLTKRIGVEALRLLVALWVFAAEYRPSGVLTGMTEEDVEVAGEWTGAPGEYVTALLELRWLDQDEAGVFSLHDWATWQPWVVGAPQRSEAARTAAKARWDEQNADRASDACGRHTSNVRGGKKSNAPPSSSPGPSSPNPTPPYLENESSQPSDSFDRFYEAYPLHAGRAQAAMAWKKLGPSPEFTERIIDDCKVRFKGVAKRYITKPANYLIRKEWEDEIVSRERSLDTKRKESAIEIARRRLKEAKEGPDGD
jgi:hypothetical protein